MPASRSPEFDAPTRAALLALAHQSIRHGLRHGRELVPADEALPPVLREPGASFVTLTRGGRLRGCIGSLEAERTLGRDVARNAWAAAAHDRRFAPLQVQELGTLELHVSVLTALEPIPAATEADLLAALRPGIDGLVLRQGGMRSTFLPQVWAQLPQAVDFLRALRRKAQLPEHFDPGGRYFRYEVVEIVE